MDKPHALRVLYCDASDQYIKKEVVVYAHGYDSDTATLFETIDRSSGLSSRTQAEKQGLYELARIYART